MKDKNNIIIKLGVIIALFSLLLTLYARIAFDERILLNDIKAHAVFALRYWEGKVIMGTPILYATTMILSFCSTNITDITFVLCGLLAFATTIRFYLTQQYISKTYIAPNATLKSYWISVLSGLSLILIFSIPIPSLFLHNTFYLNNFTPNVWHNSTIIFLFPFAILLCYYSYKQLIAYSSKRDILIFILILLNLFIKPSFFFAFVCAYPLIMAIHYKFTKTFWRSMLPLGVGMLMLFFITQVIYDTDNSDGSGIQFCFLCVYKLRSSLIELPFTIVFSLLFPILYSILNRNKLKRNIGFWYILSLLIFAFFVFFIVAEQGRRYTDGNFYWQIVPCAWLFFVFTFLSLLKDIKEEGFLRKNKLLLAVYLIHVLMGFIYIARFLLFQTAS